MQLAGPLLALSLKLCYSLLKNHQHNKPKPDTPRKQIFLKNRKVLAQWQIQEIKNILKNGQTQHVLKGKKTKRVERIEGKRLLLLDLDQTLIYAKGGNGIKLRPFAEQFLQGVSPHFQIYIFTAASKDYAFSILNKFRKELSKISGILDRQNCTAISRENLGQRVFVKELSIIDSYLPHEIIVVDDTPVTYCMNRENSIGIFPFFGDNSDNQLLKLKQYLVDAHLESDLREFLKGKPWNSSEFEGSGRQSK